MTRNWYIVNHSLHRENPALSDGQICRDLSPNSPAINFYASDPNLLIQLLADAEIGSRIETKERSNE